MSFIKGRVSIIIATGLLIVLSAWCIDVIANLFTGSSDDILKSLLHPGLRETAKRLAVIIIVIGVTGFFLEIEKNRQDLTKRERNLNKQASELVCSSETLKKIKSLLPTCVSCDSLRDDFGQWHELDIYIKKYPDALFADGYCPGCTRKMNREKKKEVLTQTT